MQPTFDFSHETIASRSEAAELQRPDPLTIRMPRVGDVVEVLWAKGWPALGWARGTVSYIAYPQSPIMSVRMDFQAFTVWDCVVSRKSRASSPNIDKGKLWRWPDADV